MDLNGSKIINTIKESVKIINFWISTQYYILKYMSKIINYKTK